MATVPTYSATGTKKEQTATLDKAVFGVEPNHQLLNLAYNSYLAAGRSAAPRTLTRGLVRGGGKKPWKQKGTGRARVGSIRVPNWRGGGVVFGPTGHENHAIKLTQKMRRQSIAQALSLKAQGQKLLVIEKFQISDGKTKSLLALLAKLKVDGRLVLVDDAANLMLRRAAGNVPQVSVASPKYLNVFTLMNADQVVITQAALDQVHEWLGGKS